MIWFIVIGIWVFIATVIDILSLFVSLHDNYKYRPFTLKHLLLGYLLALVAWPYLVYRYW